MSTKTSHTNNANTSIYRYVEKSITLLRIRGEECQWVFFFVIKRSNFAVRNYAFQFYGFIEHVKISST